ncbi:MAG: hypothetical protein Q9199_008175, partial [Rusavskia elegans]
MPSSEALTDDYVAQLLAKDAKDRTIKFSSYGLQAILPKRPTTNAPKPNTRFLKNIIKETDSHNAALRAKEIADARLRLRGINGKATQNTQRGHQGDGLRDEDGRFVKRHTKMMPNGATDEGGVTKTTAPTQRPSAPTIVDTIVDDSTEAHPPTPTELDGEDQD